MTLCYALPSFTHFHFSHYVEILALLTKSLEEPEWRNADVAASISLTVIGFFPLLTNILTVVVFLRPQFRENTRKFWHHVLLLSTSEIIFAASFVNYYFWNVVFLAVMDPKAAHYHYGIFIALFSSIVQISLFARNWMTAAVTVARCEALVKPLEHANRHYITTRRLKIFLIAVILLVLVMKLFFMFAPFLAVECGFSDGAMANMTRASSRNEVIIKTREFLFFVTKRGLPIVIVAIGTAIIVNKLLRNRKIHPQSGCRTTKTAATTLSALAITFTVFEGMGCVFHLTEGMSPIPRNVRFGFNILDKYFLLLNSLSNLFAFILCNPSFRQQIQLLLSCRSRC